MKRNGFTLIEMLLVLVIVSSFIYMGAQYFQQKNLEFRNEKTAYQIQEILNAGLAYYVANDSWPASLACLRADSGSGCTVGYLDSTFENNPYGSAYNVISGTGPSNFYVTTSIDGISGAAQIASIIAGKLPLSFTTTAGTISGENYVKTTDCDPAGFSCTIVATVNIPAQVLDNSTGIHYAGLYHHGGCVPVPTCASSTMTPQIYVAPVSVSGTNDANSGNVYPISSFTAYASGSPAAVPPACTNGTASACTPVSGDAPASGTYWRVCIQIITEKGDVALTNTGGTASSTYPYNPWGGNVTVMAVTRCAVANESSGSDFTVYTQ